MQHTHHTPNTLLGLLAILLLFVACTDDQPAKRNINFSATIESLSTDNKSAKVRLVDENWIYWELYDQITLCGDASEQTTADLINSSVSPDFRDDYNGVFVSYLEWGSRYFLGLFPHNSNNIIQGTPGTSNFGTPKIYLQRTQPLRNDLTFARRVFPMVAWYGGHWDDSETSTPYNLDFHSLAAIVRLQIYNAADNHQPVVVDSIRIASRDGKRLSGSFGVVNYKTFNPHVVPDASPSAADQSLLLTCGDEGLTLGPDSLRSFYLVLPAVAGMDSSTTYQLQMTLFSGSKHCERNFSVNTRRNGITYMRALGISTWVESGTGSSTAGLVGNGTAERPFKIYSEAELQLLRDAFSTSGEVRINNQVVDNNTHFHIMRSTMVLNNTNWTTGIRNFRGHLVYMGPNNTSPGITNNSTSPLFESIDAGAVVEGLTVRCAVSRRTNDDFSPFCDVNNGTIKDCRVSSNTGTGTIEHNTNSGQGVGGICLRNNGTIDGCGCVAAITNSGGHIAGICLENYGTIKGCYMASPGTFGGAYTYAAGICANNTNSGTITDCYFSASVTSSAAPLAGIVYSTTGGVENCYISGDGCALVSTDEVGGIAVRCNYGSVIDHCWSEAQLQGSVVGSIAAVVDGGTVINSFCNNPLAVVTATSKGSNHYGGGLVGRLADDGKIQNCYVYLNHVARNADNCLIAGLVGYVQSGSIDNCYVYETTVSNRQLYGGIETGGSLGLQNCHLVGGTATVVGITNHAISATAATMNSTLEAMKDDLNTHRPTGALPWEKATPVGSNITVPTLQYTASN